MRKTKIVVGVVLLLILGAVAGSRATQKCVLTPPVAKLNESRITVLQQRIITLEKQIPALEKRVRMVELYIGRERQRYEGDTKID